MWYHTTSQRTNEQTRNMAKKLTLRLLAKIDKQIGRHGDGGNLFLKVVSPERRFWTYRYRLKGRQTEIKLGGYPETTLDQARGLHLQNASLVTRGEDPQEDRRRAKSEAAASAKIPTFREIADEYIEAHEEAWKSVKHRQQWRNTINAYCRPFLDKPVSEVGTDAVLASLKPIWTRKPETARRVRARIEKVLGAARSRGYLDRNQINPASWRDHLEHNLPNTRKLVPGGHHKALPYADAPAFMARLREEPGTAARMLEFTLLTAKRTREVRLMTCDEAAIAIATGVWVIPGGRMGRMKMGVEHCEPLIEQAREILKAQFEARDGQNPYVFSGARPKKPLGSEAMATLLKRMKAVATVHGFRSTFRDWVGDETSFPREVAEAALAHKVGGVEGDYRRSDALKKRRELMELWGRYLNCDTGANVVSIGEAGRR
jgi:integrase